MLTINLGPIALPVNLALLYLSFFCAWLVGCWLGYKEKKNPEPALFNILILGALGARVAFVVQYFEHYNTDIWKVIDIRDGGFSLPFGIITGLLVAIYHLWRKTNVRRTLSIALTTGVVIWGSGMALVNAFESSQQLPDIALRDLQGKPLNLQDLQGKPLVVNLWATWCPPCRREMPVLEKAQKMHKDITFVYLNQGEGQQEVQLFLQQQNLTLENIFLDGNARAGQHVGSRSLPTTLFYSKDGQLKHSHLGELSAGSLAHALSFIQPSLKHEDIQ